MAAADLIQRLPVALSASARRGRVGCLDVAAARLLGARIDRLLVTLPWQAVPWLGDLAEQAVTSGPPSPHGPASLRAVPRVAGSDGVRGGARRQR